VCKVLTSISLDHTQHLGRTRAAVAREKAAAARRGVPMVCGESAASAVGRVVAGICRRSGAPLLTIGRDFRIRGATTALDLETGRASTRFRLVTDVEREFEIPLLGVHQARNAALAAVAATTARWTRGAAVTTDHVRRGLAKTTIRARLETLGTRPLVIVDGAHNPASFGVLARTIRSAVPDGPRVFVVGMSADKDVAGCLSRLRGVASFVLTTTSGQARAASPADLAAAARAAGLRAKPDGSLAKALAEARRRAGQRGSVVVTGSLYLCGEALRLSR
jgi:dihydrofolate synthase/folylpolyglutamate synthase